MLFIVLYNVSNTLRRFFKMTISDKIKIIDIRIAVLKSRGEGMNAPIIKKLMRKRRALEAQL